ncbi:hypothetical protein [Microlunatus parietis]|uniref:Phage major capsid protein, HK97 family n=1 Tax=Microlunatus parietis TaxID=682979 RepID=A0A7Y9L8V2_9ACTN|nr:hypothetical protein [Microlunatus parietis]NYE68867.1 hypothetical protein [Microlunatus parietis]
MSRENPVLTRLRDDRAEQVQFIDQLLSKVDEDGRDLVDAERSNLTAAKERIVKLDEQIKPLEEFEAIVGEHRAAKPTPSRREPQDDGGRRSRLGDVTPRPVEYPTAGHFIVDKIRAVGYPGEQLKPDAEALQRVMAAVQTRIVHQTTADTPGLLPEPIIGQILTDLDGARPFLSSIGVQNLAGIPGKVFHRPHVTQHTRVDEQTAEKTELVSRQFKVEGLPFTKRTFGGTLNVSRQDIDWTSPSAWNALITDLQMEYGADTEDTAAQEFAAAVTQTEAVTDENSLQAWIDALYQAAVKSATANGTRRATSLRLPNRIWTSIDMWASLGSVISAARATNRSNDNPGSSQPTGFAGDILDIPRVMAPGLPAGTVIVGRDALFEAYEERIGLLQAIEPKVLGVEVAYGGYAAWGMLDATAFTKLTVGS